MNTSDMYVREKLARIKQEEILREAQRSPLFWVQPRPALARRKLALILAVLIVLVTVIVFVSAGGFGLSL